METENAEREGFDRYAGLRTIPHTDSASDTTCEGRVQFPLTLPRTKTPNSAFAPRSREEGVREDLVPKMESTSISQALSASEESLESA